MENELTKDYTITDDGEYLNKKYGNPPELVAQFESIRKKVFDKYNKKIIYKLNELIVKYPQAPNLKNYLSVAYSVRDDNEKAYEINDWILKEHPDYLFGKINKAKQYLDDNTPEKVPEILGEAMELNLLYPDRNVFHISEITQYYKMAVRYYTAINDMKSAEKRYEFLEKIAPESEDTEDAFSYLLIERSKIFFHRFDESRRKRIKPPVLKTIPESAVIEVPQFNHIEILNLYDFGMEIPRVMLEEIIDLPRKTLIQDLEKLMVDAVERYHFLSLNKWSNNKNNFPLHALYILKEIDAVESLPAIFSFLEYDEEFIEFWLGDHTSEYLWQVFYSLGFNQTNELKEFLLRPNVYSFVKTAVTHALSQIGLHHSEKKEEVSAIFFEVYSVMLHADIEDVIVDTEFISFAIGDAIDCKLTELLPLIKLLFEKQYVDEFVNGDYDDVEKEFIRNSKQNVIEKVESIFDLYDEISLVFEGDNDDEEEDDNFDEDEEERTAKNFDEEWERNWSKNDEKNDEINPNNYTPEVIKPAVSSKIAGRNDPCPCGSGKKYKKCCLNKKE
jgi:hypothetical protein